jgi:hypothetical protein
MMVYLADIFTQFKAQTDRDGEISLSVAFFWENRVELKTFLSIVIEGNLVDQCYKSEVAFRHIGSLCKSKGASSCVIINEGRVRFVPSDLDEDERYFERPDFYPNQMSEAMVQLVWLDFGVGKHPFKKISVYKKVGEKVEFGQLLDAPLQPEDFVMVEAVRDGWDGP